ncbi:MAG: SOS response-associated peptidase [Bacteroidia bacterium]|nr:SOS response-associated peptidase [Bacteroidia bacterium]
MADLVYIWSKMCYTAQSLTQKAIKYAQHRGDTEHVEELQKQLSLFLNQHPPQYHVSGFAHPHLLVFTNQQPYTPQAFIWGLIPAWTKSLADAKKFWNNTLNARGESIFEKPSFKNSAINKRCLVYVDAFYEYHHQGKQTYPYRIALKSGEPMCFAGLWEEWTDRSTGEVLNTVSLVTTTGNALMTKIHNNPQAEGPRMPVILPKDKLNEWLIDGQTETAQTHLKSLLQPLNENELLAHTVGKLSGKSAMPNQPCALEPFNYPDLELAL